MWTTPELKARAREKLKKYFWDALVISIIFGLISGSGTSAARSSYESSGASGVQGTPFYSGVEVGEDIDEISPKLFDEIMDAVEHLPETAGSMLTGENMLLLSVIASILLISFVISLMIGIFVVPALMVGKNRFYVESGIMEQSAGISRIAWGFKNRYLNVTWVMFLKNLIVMLGSICFVIPGIYFSYCYAMVPYILAENPDMKARDALRLSKEMMNGNKFGMFTMELSFVGWLLLGSLIGMFTCGLGSFMVMPYLESTRAELYLELRQPFAGMLNGFGCGYGGYDAYNEPGYGPQGGAGSYYGEGQNPYGNQWNQASQTEFYEAPQESKAPQTPLQPETQPDRGGEVKRSEGGPGRGYYLNGVFYPYTEDELKELENNK